MEKKLKIGIDIDEVVCEFIKEYLKFHKENFGVEFPFEKINSYNLWETELFKDLPEEISSLERFYLSNDFDSICLVDGFKPAFDILSNFSEIYFITSRPKEIKEKTDKFFKKYFLEKSFSVIHSGDFFGNGKSKAEICKTLGIKFMVEDNKDYASDCAKIGVVTFIFDKPWNQNVEIHKNLIRVKSWNDIQNKIVEIENGNRK